MLVFFSSLYAQSPIGQVKSINAALAKLVVKFPHDPGMRRDNKVKDRLNKAGIANNVLKMRSDGEDRMNEPLPLKY